MTDKPWTDGSWTFVPRTEFHGPYIESEYGPIADFYFIHQMTRQPVIHGGDKAYANARLIAAAPEMADALHDAASKMIALRCSLLDLNEIIASDDTQKSINEICRLLHAINYPGYEK